MSEPDPIVDPQNLPAPLRLDNLNERTPTDIERQVLHLTVDSPLDALAAAMDAAGWLLARARGIDRLAREVAVAWIDRNGEFDIGQVHYSVGYSSVVKCVDVPQTGHAVLSAAGGDFDRFLGVLVAQPFKHASVRSVIGEAQHDRLFVARPVGRLVNGVPERALQRADQRFAR